MFVGLFPLALAHEGECYLYDMAWKQNASEKPFQTSCMYLTKLI